MGVRLALGLLLLAGCDSTIEADDYDRSCSDSSQCVVILVGDVCDCACEPSAINVSSYDAYQEDRSGISCSKQCDACFDDSVPVCAAGICQAQPQL